MLLFPHRQSRHQPSQTSDSRQEESKAQDSGVISMTISEEIINSKDNIRIKVIRAAQHAQTLAEAYKNENSSLSKILATLKIDESEYSTYQLVWNRISFIEAELKKLREVNK